MYEALFNPFVKLSKKAKAEREAYLASYRLFLRQQEEESKEVKVSRDFIEAWDVATNGVRD